MRLVVISPHLDDAVFSCGDLIASHPGAVVCTVFTGGPPPATPLTDWDRRCGFASMDDVMAMRRAEDRRALAWLRAEPVWLGFADAQYGPSPAVDVVAAAVDEVARTAEVVYVPLGLFHGDHALVHAAVRRLPGRVPLIAYEDVPYRRIEGLRDARVAALAADGLAPRPLPTGGVASGRKRRAILCYRSQLRGLRGVRARMDDLLAPEGFWCLRR